MPEPRTTLSALSEGCPDGSVESRPPATEVGSALGASAPGGTSAPSESARATPLRRLTVRTTTSYLYDPERVQVLYEQLQPDPDQYGDDPAYAVWSYLNESMFGSDVFGDQGDFDQWPESDEEYDPNA